MTRHSGVIHGSNLDLLYRCDICHKVRSRGNHHKCRKIRQEKHAQAILNEEFDRLLMFDKKEKPDDPPVLVPPAYVYSH